MFAKEFSGKYQERTLDTESRDVLRQAESLSAMSPPPTLKYVAIIEAHTDKAFFKFSPSDINEKKRKIINSAKDMCTQMVSKGYGGKVKRQDIMDTALNMAKK
ncbi:hypothetical protein AA0117_g2661 [Alternaria alternata]|nr:hypothetical protein AA0117_g2661 [Alternaria alternata]